MHPVPVAAHGSVAAPSLSPQAQTSKQKELEITDENSAR